MDEPDTIAPRYDNKITPADRQEISEPVAGYDPQIAAAQMAVRDVTRLTRVLSILSDTSRDEDMLPGVLSALSELFVSEVVILLDPVGTGRYYPLASLGLPEKNLKIEFSHEPDSPLTAVCDTGRPVNIGDMDAAGEIDAPLKGLGIRSCLWLPLHSGDRVRGALLLARCQSVPFDANETGVLQTLCRRIGQSLDQTGWNRQIMEILENGRITHDLKIPSIVSQVVDRFLTLTSADSTGIFLLNDDSRLYCASRQNISAELGYVYAKAIDEMITVGELPHAIILTRDRMAAILKQLRLSISPLPAVSLLVPLTIERNVTGVLAAFRANAGTFPGDMVTVATLFADQTSAAIDNAQLFKTLKEELRAREELAEELKVSDERFQALIRNVHDVISIITSKGRFVFVSPASKEAWGVEAAKLNGRRLMDRIHPEDTHKIRDAMQSFQRDGDESRLRSVRMQYGDSGWRDFEVTMINMRGDPVINGVVVTFHDVTERRRYEVTLKDMAYHDALTGMPNRKYFEEKLEQTLDTSRKTGTSFAVVFMDLDGFKLINDSLGHQWGDRLLCVVAERLQNCLRHDDFAARMSGDEFTLLLEGISTREQVAPVIERFIRALKEPVVLQNREMFISGSFGAVIGTGADNSLDMLREADIAMYQVKQRGKDGYVVFDPEKHFEKLEAEASKEMLLQSEMHRALVQGEFKAAFTPIYLLDGMQEFALEVQLNWIHPRRGRLTLMEFLEDATRAGVMLNAGMWLTGEAIRQAEVWNRRKRVPLYMRLPGKFFLQIDFASWIFNLVSEAQLDPHLVTLDVIADETSSQMEGLSKRLQTLKDMGFGLAISDYRFSFASMSTISTLPVDHIRLDASYFDNLPFESVCAILQGTKIVSTAFDANVILEGITSRQQAELVRQFGYKTGLGPGLSGPLLADEVEARHLFGL
jgi:diguanylate cyclase (GGDEF)-like protein/PAS domain S-box-containing protein